MNLPAFMVPPLPQFGFVTVHRDAPQAGIAQEAGWMAGSAARGRVEPRPGSGRNCCAG